jgi:hypothetical protein
MNPGEVALEARSDPCLNDCRECYPELASSGRANPYRVRGAQRAEGKASISIGCSRQETPLGSLESEQKYCYPKVS